MKIIFVTHGETILQTQNKVEGWADSPLTNLGVEYAIDIKQKLMNFNISKIYSSSSERAIDTAELILDNKKIELIIDRRLKDINYGTLEAMPYYILNEYNKNIQDPFDYKEANGEDVELVLNRMNNMFNKIIDENDVNDNVLVVGHNISLKLFLKQFDTDFEFNSKYQSIIIGEYIDDKLNLEVL